MPPTDKSLASLAPILLIFFVLILALLVWCILSSCIGTPILRALQNLWSYCALSARSANGLPPGRRLRRHPDENIHARAEPIPANTDDGPLAIFHVPTSGQATVASRNNFADPPPSEDVATIDSERAGNHVSQNSTNSNALSVNNTNASLYAGQNEDASRSLWTRCFLLFLLLKDSFRLMSVLLDWPFGSSL
ncbi:hypothetical protein BDN72DRAFT_898290 [Pluteus cervinus]|uniref:Uncharacterized protein n=1 Tax=Pluteus cervinus TaxID=181527 RepID=A0ACD3ATL0_9AGAR|nr:hypothetical protein BDN72DRAFT_898290 [Pluteus cervinus]